MAKIGSFLVFLYKLDIIFLFWIAMGLILLFTFALTINKVK